MFLAFQTNGSTWANEGRREEEVIWAMPKRKHSFFRGPFPVLVFLYKKFLFKLEVKSGTDAISTETVSKDSCVLLVGCAASVSA